MTMTERRATTPESPLIPFLTSTAKRARFSHRPRTPPALEAVDDLLAGAVDVDITPPPGLPKAGYSANAHDGSGFRTRLRARVLHLRAGTTSLAIVQCDLLGGSAVLQHLVSQAISATTDVPLAGLFIGATHTHAGPGQYLGTDFYNRFASNRSGFDPGFAQFLVERISAGITEAVAARRPARLAVGTTDVWGLTRNRSLDAHVRNPSVGDPSTTAERKFWSVNPQLHVIRVDAVRDGKGGRSASAPLDPLAALVVFSVHGTGVSMRADEYNADIWAYLVGEMRQRIEDTTGYRPVVGAIEGTHADVAPAIRPGTAGHLEAARVGRAVGAEAAALHASLADQLSSDIVLGAGLREVDLDRSSVIDHITLPHRPAVGAALVAGAHENRTPVVNKIPPFAPGRPKRWGTDNPQGAKWIIGSRWLQPLILPRRSFPRVLPVQTLRIGDSMLVGLPFELTVDTGRRIEEAVIARLDQTGSDVTRVIVSSVANEYSGYAATAEEYELQHYEGAHTLYGPSTQPFLAAHAARLAGETSSGSTPGGVVQDVLTERRFDLELHHHLPVSDGRQVDRRILGPAIFVDPTANTDGYWELLWRDVSPADLHWYEPLVHVEVSEGANFVLATREGRRVDDQGWELQVTYLGVEEDGHHYSVRWWDPAFRGGHSHRFVLDANNGRPQVISSAFH